MLAWMAITVCQVYAGSNVQCWYFLIASINAGTTCFVTHVVRASRILLYYSLQEQKFAQQQNMNFTVVAKTILTPSGVAKSMYNERLARWCTDRNFFILSLTVSFVAIVAEWVPFLTEETTGGIYDASGDSCANLNVSRYIMVAVIGR